jgi:hypothetical protein
MNTSFLAADAEVPVIFLNLALEKKRLWTRLRIRGSKIRRSLDWFRMVDRITVEARSLMEPRGAFRLLSLLEVKPGAVRLAGGIELRNLRENRYFDRTEKIALCAITLGRRLEEHANELAIKGDYPEASVFSIIGDCALTEAQEKLKSLAETSLEGSGLRAGIVLQPGAQYWNIEGNGIFPRVLPLEALGIRVLDSFAVAPSKSKTFACVFSRPGSAR